MPSILNAQQIIEAALIEDLFTNDGDHLIPSGKDKYAPCFYCGKEGKRKGLSINKKLNIAKCFSCDKSVTPGNYYQNRHAVDFVEAIKRLSDITKIPIQYEETKKTKNKAGTKKTQAKEEKTASNDKSIQNPMGMEARHGRNDNTNFLVKQLAASGLTLEGTQSEIKVDDKTLRVKQRYTSGTKDEAGNIITGDDMILHYVNLHRQLETYYRKKKNGETTGTPQVFTRIRNQFPAAPKNLDRNGKPKKYASPYGSGCHIWHPEIVIKKYNRKAEIKHLHIQEGEKKADKASMHGLISCGIGGITMLAENQQLNSDFSDIITTCNTTDVYFWVDSDWQDIGANDKNVAGRSYMFLGAIRNFLNYFKAFYNSGIDLRLHLCYVNKVESIKDKVADGTESLTSNPSPLTLNTPKGIDDLLVLFKDREEEILQDWETARMQADGHGKYVSCIDITHYTENNLKKLFHLETYETFFEFHHKELAQRKEFFYFKTPYVYKEETNTFELKHPITEDEQWYIAGKARDNQHKYYFDLDNFQIFCQNRLLGRLTISKNPDKIKLILADINTKTINFINAEEVVLWLFDFLDSINETSVKNFFHQNDQFFEEKKLMRLRLLDDKIKLFSHNKSTGYLFFANGFWQITAQGITVKTIKDSEGYVWSTQVKDFEPTLITE